MPMRIFTIFNLHLAIAYSQIYFLEFYAFRLLGAPFFSKRRSLVGAVHPRSPGYLQLCIYVHTLNAFNFYINNLILNVITEKYSVFKYSI